MENEYSTKNLNLAAYIYASGVNLIGTERVNGEVFFRFTPKGKAAQLVSLYFSGQANINPRDLFARLNDLKDLIFDQRRTR